MPPSTDITTRALVVTLKSPSGGKTTTEIAEITGISTRQVNGIYARAIERGFDPNHRPLTLRDEYLRDAPRSGRPTKQTEERKNEVIVKVRRDLLRQRRDGSRGELCGWHPSFGALGLLDSHSCTLHRRPERDSRLGCSPEIQFSTRDRHQNPDEH